MLEKNKPSLRYEEFTNAWEQRKLDSIVDRLKSYSLSRNVETSEYTGYKYIHYGDIHTKVANLIDESSNLPNIKAGDYELLERGDLVLADASEDYQGIATPAVITIDTPYKLVSGLHTIALRPKQVDSLFLYYLINSPTFRKYGYKIGTGMKVFGISVTNLLKFESMFPLLEEQIKIGDFFKKLDNTISLYHRKYKKLKQIKKALLIQMFPKDEEDKPELRLNGFEEAWKQCKLGDCFSERNERTSEGELISVTINSGVVKASSLERKDSSSEDKSKYKKVEVGDIAYNSMRMWQGASGVSNYSGIVSPAYTVIIPNSRISSLFFSYQFKLTKMIQTFQSNSQGLTSDTWNLKYPLLKDIKVLVPSYEEQIKIGSFFKQLDDTIALNYRKYEKLQQIKKALLKEMFV